MAQNVSVICLWEWELWFWNGDNVHKLCKLLSNPYNISRNETAIR